MRLLEYIRLNKKDKNFKKGDFVGGNFGSDDVVVHGVYIATSGTYHHLVSMYKPGTKKPVWGTIYNIELVKDEKPPDDLLRYAQKNPYWNAKPGEKIKMETNI